MWAGDANGHVSVVDVWDKPDGHVEAKLTKLFGGGLEGGGQPVQANFFLVVWVGGGSDPDSHTQAKLKVQTFLAGGGLGGGGSSGHVQAKLTPSPRTGTRRTSKTKSA